MLYEKWVAIICLTLGLAACGRSRDDREHNSPAFKVGEVSHALSKELGKAAKATGRELNKESHQAREGWNQAERNDKEKHKNVDR